MRVRVLLLAALLPAMATPVWAQDFGKPMANLLRQPAYALAWRNLMAEETLPEWVTEYAATLDGPPTPVLPVELDGEQYRLGFTCKPNACEENQLFVLFKPGGGGAWGLLASEPTGTSWLGKPDKRIKTAIAGALE